MKASDREATALYESLAAVIGQKAAGDFRVELKILMRRYLREYEQRIHDAEVAELLPQGWRAVVERFGGSKSSAYRWGARHQRSQKIVSSGTQPLDESEEHA
jgi:hypothetical protein